MHWRHLQKEAGGKVSQQGVIDSIQEEFGWEIKCGALRNMKKREQEIMKISCAYEERQKRIVRDRLANLNDKLEAWYNTLEENAIITDNELRKKAKEIVKKENLVLTKDFIFSHNWLLRFKRKRDIGKELIHGEAGDANEAGIEMCREFLPRILARFRIKDIYNLDETGLFYRRLPTRSLMRKKRKGNKLNKIRCTVNVIANAPGSDIHLQLIGQSKRPRAFGKTLHPFNHFHIDYYNNDTSWMRSDIFASVIKKFSNRVRRKNNGRQVLLIMDYYSAHKMEHDRVRPLTFEGGFRGFQFDNVVCLFLPPNVTSVIQPLDQGIIAAFKSHYRRQHVAFNLQELDKGVKQKEIKVNMLQVLQWMREARRHVQGETVANCWIKSGILPAICENELRGGSNRKAKRGAAKFKQDFDALATELSKINLPDAPTAEELLTMPCERVEDQSPSSDITEGEQHMQEQNEQTTSDNEDNEVDGDEEDDVDDALMDIPLVKAKEYATALHHFVVNNVDQPRMLEFEEISMRLEKAINQMVDCSSKRQTDISSFFPIVTEGNQHDNDEDV